MDTKNLTPLPDGSLLYSAALAEGCYEVVVDLGSPDFAASTSVWAECRRLMVRELATGAGELRRARFLVDLRSPTLPPPPPTAPGGSSVILYPEERRNPDWDDLFTLEFSGERPAVGDITIRTVSEPRTVYLAGDSTVTDQLSPAYASWGQMLPCFLSSRVDGDNVSKLVGSGAEAEASLWSVANHAQSGQTLKSFLTDLRLAKILSRGRAGDLLVIQFGHNDQKDAWPQTYASADRTFKAYLRVYVEEALQRMMKPVLVTSPQRRHFDGAGRIVDSHGAYPDATRSVASEYGIPLIDLEQASRCFYEALGPDDSALAFAPGDRSHHSPYGAYELARFVAGELDHLSLLSQASQLLPFDPASPDLPAATLLDRTPSAAAPGGIVSTGGESSRPRGD